jgi:hypothetical protein
VRRWIPLPFRLAASAVRMSTADRPATDSGSLYGMAVDAWMQHPTLRFLHQEMF